MSLFLMNAYMVLRAEVEVITIYQVLGAIITIMIKDLYKY